MSRSAVLTSIRRLRSLLAVQQDCEQSDEELLAAFADCRDEIAFAALVRRYGPMVLGVCRRVLGHAQDAEDAYQATFLVLARRAAVLRDKTALASFLYGTAYHLASKIKRAAGRRRKYEGSLGALTQPRSPADPADELLWREVRQLLDEEIARLPEKYRSVFVLCCLENLSRSEAAQRLGLKERTVLSRLAEARKRLSQRLARRGVELTAVLAATTLAAPSAPALPAGLMASTVKAAMSLVAGQELAGMVSASVAELVQSATAAMIGSKAKIATMLLLTASILAGAGVWRSAGFKILSGGRQPPDKGETRGADAPRSAKNETAQTEIQGRVVDPEDKPVKNACLHWPRLRKGRSKAEYLLEIVERGQTDDEGHFRIPLAAGDDLDDSLRTLIVTATGYGLNWLDVPKAKSSENITVRLRKDMTIRGRILSMEGKPLAGVRVLVDHLEEMPNGRLDDYLAFWDQDWNKALWVKTRRLEMPSPTKLSMLPPTVTDRNGRFQFSGVGSERMVYLAIRGEGVVHTVLPIVARPDYDPTALNKSARTSKSMMGARIPGPPPVLYSPTFDYVAPPARVVEGVVREAGSGKPIPGVRIRGNTGYRTDSDAITDKEGRYLLEGLPKVKRYAYFHAMPAGDGPWLPIIQDNIEAGEGLQPVRVDFTLGRGVIVTGRVIDRTTGKGVTCSIQYAYLPDNKFAGKPGYPTSVGSSFGGDDEGRFHFKVAPGTGVLEAAPMAACNPYKLAQFDAEDCKYITFTKDGDFVAFGGGGGFLSLQNAVKRLDLAPDAGVVERNLYLERGATSKVRIRDPAGNPLPGVMVSGIDAMPGQHIDNAYDAPEAECTIVALDPHRPRQVIFYHPKKRLAGSLLVRGDEKQPLTVRLAPTGTVIGRVTDADGQPLRGAEIEVGASGQLTSTNLSYLYLHLNHTGLLVRTDKEGRFRLEGVVPDEKIAVSIRRRGAYLDGGPRTKQLKVTAAQTLDLGDIRIKPAE